MAVARYFPGPLFHPFYHVFCTRMLSYKDSINRFLCPLVSSWVCPIGNPRRRLEEGQDIYSQDSSLQSCLMLAVSLKTKNYCSSKDGQVHSFLQSSTNPFPIVSLLKMLTIWLHTLSLQVPHDARIFINSIFIK